MWLYLYSTLQSTKYNTNKRKKEEGTDRQICTVVAHINLQHEQHHDVHEMSLTFSQTTVHCTQTRQANAWCYTEQIVNDYCLTDTDYKVPSSHIKEKEDSKLLQQDVDKFKEWMDTWLLVKKM